MSSTIPLKGGTPRANRILESNRYKVRVIDHVSNHPTIIYCCACCAISSLTLFIRSVITFDNTFSINFDWT